MTKTKRPTLQMIAEQVGVTKMTISRYLRNPLTVSEKIVIRLLVL